MSDVYSHPEERMSLPLSGVTVLDLSRVLAGPYCTMVLGDPGADVIKVERLPGGDSRQAAEMGLVDILADDVGAELARFLDALRAADMATLGAIRELIREAAR
jgi:crotonobetainyl-CoA:carnitine CoA-transferase CaiB-like acyl-CoA transferase